MIWGYHYFRKHSGEVFRSQRFVHRFTCPMVFTRLPFDEQVCTIKRLTFLRNGEKWRLDPFLSFFLAVVLAEKEFCLPFGVHRFFFGNGVSEGWAK